MHPASMENMKRCVDWYLPEGDLHVIDLGASDVNGSYRQLMPARVRYTGFDLAPGPGVDVVLDDPYSLPLPDASVDLVLSGQMIEHCAHFWRVFTAISRVLKPGGLAFINAPSAGPIHRYPVDCYRFYPDAYQALADWAGLRLVHCWRDERGPWCDLLGVFQKGGDLQPLTAPPKLAASILREVVHPEPAAEITKGARPYLEVLADLHELVKPGLYAEIGVRRGNSLRLARCEAVAVDPEPALSEALPDRVTLHDCASDDFFFFHGAEAYPRPPDLAFIDGMHLLEFALRDFMNVERLMRRKGVIVIDDVLPNHPVQAERDRQSRVWCGDVWRIVPLLRKHRPDLKLTLFDTAPTGLLVITRLAPANKVLWNGYNRILRDLAAEDATLPPEVLDRSEALEPTRAALAAAISQE
ncbi:methyltransferase family protein [Rhodobacter viridis]|uniref:Methyltransferase family protein n=2 Tax=Rhodobacter viridis TaxID=1054202 RepID=A0A318U112_9RHOB|nr:methyltransferase family protein [Rhodobacter viridis]